MSRLTTLLLLLCLSLCAQPVSQVWNQWRNGIPTAIQTTFDERGVTATVIGTHRWDTDILHPLEHLTPNQDYVFSAITESDSSAWCFISVKVYRQGKEQRRIVSPLNKRGSDTLSLVFSVKEGETAQALLRTHCGEDLKGHTVRFHSFDIRPYEPATQQQPPFTVVPGYTVCSLYLNNLQVQSAEQLVSRVAFRKADEANAPWQEALPLTFIDGEARAASSLVKLQPQTRYQVKVTLQEAQQPPVTHEATFTTKGVPENVVRTVLLTQKDMTAKGILIQDTPENGYVRYATAPGTVLTAPPEARFAIRVDCAKNVILDGLVVRGGRRAAIQVFGGQNIVIRNCDIAGFGVPGIQDMHKGGIYFHNKKGLNNDAGIALTSSSDILIENNYFHDPVGTANSWVHSHPAGPNAIFVGDTVRATVRYNDCIGGPNHRWNDAIEGLNNGGVKGSFAKDAEIYGNYLAFGNDDGIELDGGQQNCRFFFNKSQGLLCGVSTAPCLVGPSFLFQNLITDLGDEYGLTNVGFKNVFSNSGKGLLRFFNNTIRTRGSGFSDFGGRKTQAEQSKHLLRGVGRNNLIDVSYTHLPRGLFTRFVSDFDYDFLVPHTDNHRASIDHLQQNLAQEQNALIAQPDYLSPEGQLLALRPDSPGSRGASHIPNFMTASDIAFGAFQADGPQLLPARPVPFTLSTTHLAFRLDQQSLVPRQHTVTLIPDAQATEELPFHIRIPDCASYLQVSPLHGTLKPGQNLTLTVTVRADRIHTARPHNSAFIVRTALGLARPISVTVDSSDHAHFRQAERRHAIHGTASFSDDRKTVTLSFDVPQKGDYFLFARFESAPPKLVTLTPDAPPNPNHLFTSAYASHPRWALVGNNTYMGKHTRPLTLEPGTHTIVLQSASADKALPPLLDCALDTHPSVFLNAPQHP